MNPLIPITLPPPLVLSKEEEDPGHPLLGEPIAYDDLVPGEEYIHRFIFPGLRGTTIGPDYELIQFISKTPRDFTYEEFPMRFNVNQRGDPLPPYSIPQAPSILPRQRIYTQVYNPRHDSFFRVSPVKKGRHFVGSQIKEKLKKNIQRKHLNLTLNKLGFSTNVGTGPANTIRKFLNVQPPKGAKSMPLRTRKEGGKRRKTRKNKR